jgi:predicted MFS family arabinose efflux permease
MVAVSATSESLLFRVLRMVVLLSAPVLAGAVQLAVIPAQTGMAAYFTGEGMKDGAFAAQNVMTIAAPAMAFGAPAIGWLSGLVGKRNTLLASMIIYGLAGMAGAYMPNLYSLLASRLLLGIASAGYITMAVSLIGDYYEGEGARDRLLGWFAIVGGGGSLVVLEAAGVLTKMDGWRAPFALYGVALALFVLALFFIKDVKRAPVARTGTASDSIWGAWYIYALIILISISMYAVTIQGTYVMNDEGITDSVVQSNVILFSTIGSMVGAYLFRFVRPNFGFYLTLALTWAVLAAGNIGFVSSLNVYVLGACAALVGAGSGFMQPLTQGAVLNMVTPAAVPRAMGMALGCIFAGQFVHPFVVTPIRAAFGLHNAFLFLGIASLAAAVISALWRFVGARRAVA